MFSVMMQRLLAAGVLAVVWGGMSSGCGSSAQLTTAPSLAPAVTPSSPPSPSPSTSSGGTFTQVNQQILQPLCISCHNTDAQSPNLSSYLSFATNPQYVVPGKAGASLIYTVTANGQMPQGEPPLTTSQQELLGTWINAGALNN